MELIEAREVTAPLSDEAYRGPGRPRESKRKINKPAIAGWHDEAESARRLGEDIRTRGAEPGSVLKSGSKKGVTSCIGTAAKKNISRISWRTAQLLFADVGEQIPERGALTSRFGKGGQSDDRPPDLNHGGTGGPPSSTSQASSQRHLWGLSSRHHTFSAA